MTRLFLLVISLAVYQMMIAQSINVRGVIIDSENNRTVSGAVVFVRGSVHETVSGFDGEFALLVADSLASHDLVVSRLGYETLSVPLDIVLSPKIEIYISRSGKPSDDDGDKPKGSKVMWAVNEALDFVMNDWVALGRKDRNWFDFGRLQTIPTMNPIEGVRLRGGIASTARMHPHFFVKGYVAYGFKDQKMKYRGEAIYSFNRKEYFDGEFGRNDVKLIYENDIFSPGEIHPRGLNDLLLVTYRRSENETTYRRFVELNQETEHGNGLRHIVWLRKSVMVPQGELQFNSVRGGEANSVHDLKNFEVGAGITYNPNQTYLHSGRNRSAENLTAPLIYLAHSVGFDNVMGGQTAYHRTEVSVQKRFRMASFATLDMVGEYAKVWNAVPFPLLVYPNQRNRFLIENNAFFLSRSLEFAADQQATLRGVMVGDDLLLKKVPILDKLGVRELVSFRATYGVLSSRNNPSHDENLFLFPVMMHEYEKNKPYIEGTIGITNILGLLRLEYVHRFNYRNYPDALLGAVRLDITL